MTAYRATTDVPPSVKRAIGIANEMQFADSCGPELGRLLRLLASQFRGVVIGEIGAGCGVGTAWIASGLTPDSRLITVEGNHARATAVDNLFRDDPNVTIIAGDWREILPYGPFAMLFVDVHEAKYEKPEAVIAAMRPGGVIVLDDLSPEEYWPEERRGRPDPLREIWLNEPRLIATEVLVTQRSCAILATRS